MFYRKKFVSNSSSTTFIAFGVILDHSEIENICEYFIQKDPEKALDYIKEWYKGDLEYYQENPIAYIMDNGMEQDFLDQLLPKGISITKPPDSEYLYISIGFPQVYLDNKGTSHIKDSSVLENGYRILEELLSQLNINKQIILHKDSWWS